MGYIIDTDGLHPTIDKLSKIANAKEPIDVNEVESFLGLVNYYRDFIPNASALMEPLNRLRRKDVTFHWGKNERDAFQSLKSAINNSSLLVHFNPNLPLKLTTDASKTASGGVLSHIYADGSERPIAFTSRTFTSAERQYSNSERESLAVIHAVKKFYDYLYGRSCTICSDHKPLEKLLGPTKEIPRMTSSRIQAWALYLSQFKYNFEYKPGCKIPHADFMSRVETEKETTLEHVEDQISSDTILTFEVFEVSLIAPSISLHRFFFEYQFSKYVEAIFSKAFSEGCIVLFGLDFMLSSGGSFTPLDALVDFRPGSNGIKCSRLR